MNVAIIGYGLEGESALTYWQKQGAKVTICDIDTSKIIPAGANSQLGPDYLNDLDRFDVIMRTAGLAPHIILQKNPGVEAKITTVINEFLRVCPTKNIIGITGTKGKGTTCTLTTKMLQAAGKEVFLGGNIGLSPFVFLAQLTPDSWVVLELSSFQLIDIKHAPHIAMCLMVVPEHLNWHADMPEYVQAKSQLFAHQSPNDIAIYFANNPLSQQIASASPGNKLPYYAAPGAYVENNSIVIDGHVICSVDELKLLGKHNWQNACAATTAFWQAIQSPDAVRTVLTTATGLPHRIEYVRTINDIDYYDDSFGTTPETAIVAIEAFSQPKVVILGGADKGTSFDQLVATVINGNVRHVIAIGTTGPKIAEQLRAGGFMAITPGGTTMAEIVATAQNAAQAGDVVLLSTGCASFGLFANYKDRGDQFKEVVGAL